MSRSYIPEEIILNILSRLQVKTLFRFRCVRKSWCNLLTSSNHDFVRMHLDHAVEINNCSIMIHRCADLYSIDSVSSSSELCYEAVKIDLPFESGLVPGISDSCNGLFCSTDFKDNFYIWNPSTKEYKEIPPPPTTMWSSNTAYGISYDCKIDDYKIVRIVSFPSVEINVYSLLSISWRKVQSVPHSPFSPKQRAGLLLNGAIHWIDLDNYTSKVIVSFDIDDERFQDIELPNCLGGEFTSNVSVLRGDLCVVGNLVRSHDVWVMKDYKVIESWTRLYTIARETSISAYSKLLRSFKNGEILFQVRLENENDHIHALVSYDPKHDRVIMLKIQGSPNYFMDVQTYVGSLVSPKGVQREAANNNEKKKKADVESERNNPTTVDATPCSNKDFI